MIELQEITIDKKELFEKYLSRKCSLNSEFTFTNLFMWRKSYDMRYFIMNDMLCIMPRHGSGPRSGTFPIGWKREDGSERDIRPVIEAMLEFFENNGQEPLIRLYDDEAVQKLVEVFPGRFLITEDVNYFDYVYDIGELTRLSGKKFHTKKNHVNKFKKLYDYSYSEMTPADKQECIDLFEKWYENKKDEIDGIDEEREAVMEMIGNWENLSVTGGCIRIGGEMAAFSFGEPLCGNTVVIHLEHANTEFEGAFAAINQLFLEHEWQDYTWVNREEDMGIPGMRKAKESYRPVTMVKKYVATLMPKL